MVFKPRYSWRDVLGLPIALLLIGLDAGGIWWLARQSGSTVGLTPFVTFLFGVGMAVVLAMAIFVLWLSYANLSLEYWLDRQAFTIVWAGYQEVIPLS